MKSVLYDQYQKEIKAKLQKNLGIKNSLLVPKVEKICINIGMGSYLTKLGSKDFSFVEENMIRISGQKPVLRKAKLSVSNFKLRQDQPIGLSVTLRGKSAYNFLYKLINIVYPRVRDFQGVSPNIFDKNGNCSLGFKDHTVFLEGKVPEDSRKTHGVQVTVVTSTDEINHSKALLTEFGFPFIKNNKPK